MHAAAVRVFHEPSSPALPSSSVYVPLGVLPLPIALADAALALAAEEVLPSPAAVARPLNADSPGPSLGPTIKASHDVIDLLSSPWSHNESHVPLAVTRSRRILSAAATRTAPVEKQQQQMLLPPPLAARKKADAAAAAAAAAVATAVALFDESAAAAGAAAEAEAEAAAEAAAAADGAGGGCASTERQVRRMLRAHHTDAPSCPSLNTAPSCPWVGPRSTRSTRRALQPRTGNEAQHMAAGRVVPNAAASGRAAALATDGGMALKGEARSYAAIERRRGVLSHK